jgi:WD repeat-containing protein 35
VITKVNDLYQIQLLNSIGTALDSKLIKIEPEFISMSQTHIIIASQDHLYCWQYRNQVSRLTTFNDNKNDKKLNRELAWYIDENPDPNSLYDLATFNKDNKLSEDPICGITVNSTGLFIGR